MTKRALRMTAAGVRTWADITRADASAEPAARWMTWREAAARHPGLQGAQDKEAYEQLMSELGAEEWRHAREEWFARVARGEWRGERAEAVADGQTWTWERIVAARRTATCFGGTEYLVRWGGEWDDSWVKEVDMANAKTAAVQHEMREAVAKRWRAVSLFERAVGKEAVEEAAAATREKRDGHEQAWRGRWKAIRVEEGAGAASVKAEETERAMVGDMREAATQDAVVKVWRAHRAHAAVEGGPGASKEGTEVNITERPTRETARGSSDGEGTSAARYWRTLYRGGKEAVDEEASTGGREQRSGAPQAKRERSRAGLDEDESAEGYCTRLPLR